jgi:hypothetical protein
MLFTFHNSDHAPMRVRVFEGTLAAEPDSGNGGGVYVPFDAVPYQQMWRDDVVWMPSLLQNPGSYFEGHFVFDGGPSAASPLLQHNWAAFTRFVLPSTRMRTDPAQER